MSMSERQLPLTRADRGEAAQRMPRWVKWPLAAVVAIAVLGALYLLAVRGEALLLDLSRLAAYCF